MSFCIANPSRCLEILASTRLLLAPIAISGSAQSCVDEALARGIHVIRDDFTEANRVITRAKLDAIEQGYRCGPQSWFSPFTIRRPPCAFIRGLRSGLDRWRLFVFNSCEVGSDLGRHVMSSGAGFAGTVVINLPSGCECERVEGYVEDLIIGDRCVRFDLVGAFAIAEGRIMT